MENQKKLKSTESNTVQGDDLFNRTFEKTHILEMITDGQHLLLTGQRRMGKSSLAREVGRVLTTDNKYKNWKLLFVDLQSCRSSIELVVHLAEELYKHQDFKNSLSDWLSSLFKKTKEQINDVNVGGISAKIKSHINDSNWREKGRELFDKIESSEGRVLLVFDEFPDVVTKINKSLGTQGVEDLLNWLRPEIQATVPNNNMSIIVSGSIGLEPVIIRLKLTDLINNLATFRLKPWNRKTAKECFRALANYRNMEPKDEIFNYFLNELGSNKYVPQHIQKCWARLYVYLQEEEKNKIEVIDAKHVFENIVLRKDSKSMISHYENRLEETLGENLFVIAIDILDDLCNGDRIKFEEIGKYKQDSQNGLDIKYIFDVLAHDGYLEEQGTSPNISWEFEDSLLRKWWSERKIARNL